MNYDVCVHYTTMLDSKVIAFGYRVLSKACHFLIAMAGWRHGEKCAVDVHDACQDSAYLFVGTHMGACLSCIYNIPICGGWCDPSNESPEQTILRRFSNEKTIPGNLRKPQCRAVCEHSACCRACGEWPSPGSLACRACVGLCGPNYGHDNRFCVMMVGVATNLLALLLILVATLAYSKNDLVVEAVPWAKATVDQSIGPHDVHGEFYVGITRGVQRLTLDGADAVKSGFDWDNDAACARPNVTNGTYFTQPSLQETCETCKDAIGEVTTLAILGALTQIPTIATNLQRATPFGDVNCQRAAGIGTNLFGLFSTCLSLRAFAESCWRDLPEEFEIVGTGVTLKIKWCAQSGNAVDTTQTSAPLSPTLSC